MNAEWIKLRTVRSTHYALLAGAAMIVLGLAWTAYVGSMGRPVRAAAPEGAFLQLLQISLAVLGVLAVTSEYATGMIRSTLMAVPDRRRMLAAKAGVVALVTFLSGSAILLTTYATSRLAAGDRSLGFNATSFGEDLPRLFASALSVTVLALVGLGIGTLTRSTAGGVVGVVVLLFVLPGVANFLPAPWGTRVSSLMVPALIQQVADRKLSTRLGEGLLDPPVALGVMALYGVLALTLAIVAISRRDA